MNKSIKYQVVSEGKKSAAIMGWKIPKCSATWSNFLRWAILWLVKKVCYNFSKDYKFKYKLYNKLSYARNLIGWYFLSRLVPVPVCQWTWNLSEGIWGPTVPTLWFPGFRMVNTHIGIRWRIIAHCVYCHQVYRSTTGILHRIPMQR